MMKPLRVLYVDNSVGFGGAIKSLSQTIREVPGLEPFVFTSQENTIVQSLLTGLPVWPFRRHVNYRTMRAAADRVKEAVPTSVLRWPVLKGLAAGNAALTLVNALKIARFIRTRKVSLVHLNNGLGPPDAILGARLANVPCIVHFRNFHRSSVKRGSGLSHIVGAIAVSNAVADEVHPSVLPRHKIRTIYNPVDLKLAEQADAHRDQIRSRHQLQPSDIVLGIFGRVIPWKGQIIFVEAAIELMRQNDHVRAMIVGDESDGGSDYFERIRHLIEQEGMAERFILPGFTTEVESYYAAVDVVVHASTEPEPFGRVVAEGMAAGRPVIATDAGGPCELITHGTDGLLVPPGSVDAMASAFRLLVDDPGLRKQMGAAAAVTASSRFSTGVAGKLVRAMYDELVQAD